MSIRIARPDPGSGDAPVATDDDDAVEPVPRRIFRACQTLIEAAPSEAAAPGGGGGAGASEPQRRRRAARLDACRRLRDVSGTVDAYLELRGVAQARGPPLDWALFRKAYTVLMWVRPVTAVAGEAAAAGTGDPPPNADADVADIRYDRSPSIERCFYRFATEPDNSSRCHGIVVHAAPWTLVREGNGDGGGGSGFAETIVTAITLPSLETSWSNNYSGTGTAAPPTATRRRVSVPVRLPLDGDWHLLAFTHACPYLKRPQWTVALDGQVVLSTELDYPVLPAAAAAAARVRGGVASGADGAAALMQDHVLLQNVAAGGILVPPPASDPPSPHHASSTPATDAAVAVSGGQVHPLSIQVSGLGVYPDAVSPTIQAVVAASARGACLTAFGMIPAIPPIANWSKGSSASEGLPKVGIPLMVHAMALEIQKLSDHVVFGVTANDAYVVGRPDQRHRDGAGIRSPQRPHREESSNLRAERIILTMSPQPGSMSDTPRVGLVQPGQPVRMERDDWPSLYVTGNVALVRAIDKFQRIFDDDDRESDDQTTSAIMMAPWSVAIQEQGILSAVTLPFFLALTPPGKLFGAQEILYQNSIRQLHDLYMDRGEFAAQLIHLLATLIQTGGARVQEEVLQGGFIHILASSLRLSLVRANRINMFSSTAPPKDFADMVKRLKRIEDDGNYEVRSNTNASVSPQLIPALIVEACERLIDVCCGPSAPNIEALSPTNRVVRTSDLALTALFAFALDFDLWGADALAGARIYKAVANRYGDFCITFGYIMRSQISVQFFLDSVRDQYETQVLSTESEMVGLQLCRMLTAMLLASLSNRRSISQAEHDVAACVRALTGVPLGSLMAHIILNALVGVLVFCDVLPSEVAIFYTDHSTTDEHKMQVAARMGRNVLMSEFLGIVGPIIISRTVFPGDNTLTLRAADSSPTDDAYGSLSWQKHWRLSLLLFSWIASIAGSEGLHVAKSTGQLLLASAHAGSLLGAMDGITNDVISALFLPSPAVALIIGHALRSDWSYHEMLADRLHIMVPLLPGMIISMLPRIVPGESTTDVCSVSTLINVLISVSAAFQRVFANLEESHEGSSDIVKSVKALAPHLVLVALYIEQTVITIKLNDGKHSEEKLLLSFRDPSEIGSHIDGSSDVDISFTSFRDILTDFPSAEILDNEISILSALCSSISSVLLTSAALINVAFNYAGAGIAHALWNVIVGSLEESVSYCAVGLSDTENQNQSNGKKSAFRVLCRLMSLVMKRSMKRAEQWDLWTYEQSSAVSTICLKIEDTGLLQIPVEVDPSGNRSLGDDQISLLFAVLEILAYGRDVMGWCQLSLPALADSVGEGSSHLPSAASKIMLPVLKPCLRILLKCICFIDPAREIKVKHAHVGYIDDATTEYCETKPLLAVALTELDSTLTAAIVGLSLPAACDIALQAMSALREAVLKHGVSISESVEFQLNSLFAKVVNELRVKFESEKQAKDRAVYNVADAERNAEQDSEAVEKLILGSVFNPAHQTWNGILDNDNSVRTLSETSQLPLMDLYSAVGEYCLQNEGTPMNINQGTPALQNAIDAWETNARSKEVHQVMELFGSSLHKDMIHRGDDKEMNMSVTSSIVTFGPETTADAVSAFFECSATEKARVDEMSCHVLLNQRCNKLSYTERYCWARHLEMTTSDSSVLWERGLLDGNRDIRSRIPTVPCLPEFRKFVPSFLDHFTDESEPLNHDESSSKNVETIRTSLLTDMDTFTKNLLEAGTLEIVDITKHELPEDEEEPDILDKHTYATAVDHEDDDAEYLESNDTIHSEEGDIVSSSHEERNKKSTEAASVSRPNSQAQGRTISSNSAFSTPPDNSSSSMHLIQSNAAGIEHYMDDCLHVRAEGSRVCSILLTGSHLILEYEAEHDGYFEGEVLAAKEDAQREQILREAGEYNENDPEGQYQRRVDLKRREIALMRPQSIRWNLSEVSHVYLRRYRLRDSSLEIFFIPSGGASFGGMGMFSPSSSIFLDFGPGREGLARRDDMAFAIMQRSPPQAVKQWPDRSAQFLHDQLSRLTLGWAERRITNFDYLLHLNMLSGRSYNDCCQYPVFPWVLADYESETVPNLTDPANFRDLSKPMGALNEQRLADFKDRFESFIDPSIPPFMYGSHYSTSAGVVLHFLVRLHPFAGLHRQLQGGHFDVADRLFSSVPRTWGMCTGTSAAEVKELTPEWYCNPAFLRNTNQFKLGTSQDGDVLGDVILPPWANNSPEKFIEVMRAALESDICSEMLPNWIDLIFGRKQQGPEAIKANNVFFYLTYYGSVDVASIEDESLRQATELQIAHFGQTPMQLFRRHHISRFPLNYGGLSFYQFVSAYSPLPRNTSDYSTYDEKAIAKARNGSASGEFKCFKFSGSPMSYWVHLDAPPPGPHAALVGVRFAGTDRCLAIDEKGIFHTFRWAWRSEESIDVAESETGCFIAQRELPRFRSVPRLMHVPPQNRSPAIAISKTLFAGRSVLLVLSDGDGKGGLGMQLVDPSKGAIRGEVLIPAAHSCEITCITMDPIGTAAGHGGVGGELALVASADGCASLWRFMSSHYLPLRPRAKLSGHGGARIYAAALNSTIHVAATVSEHRFCLHSIGNGNLIRSFGPPKESVNISEDSALCITTKFADTRAVAISSQGFLVAVCESVIEYTTLTRTVTTLNLFSVEGVFLGSRPVERWRGRPHSMSATPDGTALLVCAGRGVTVHRLSCCDPLEILDEWVVTESDDLSSPAAVDHAFDLDLGPSLNRPVAAAAACSNGVLRLHALPGISQWSERHKMGGFGSTVGNAFVKPAQTMNRALKEGLSFGSRIAGLGREIGKEVSSEVKSGGFFGNIMKRRTTGGNS